MKVTTEIRQLKLKSRWQISRGSLDHKEIVVVYLTHDGITGMGEASPNTRYGESVAKTLSAIEKAREIIASKDPFHYQVIKAEIEKVVNAQSCARAALDIALMDWVGKALKLPLFRMWGADPVRTPLSSYTIGIDTPEMIREKVRNAASYPLLKIKLGVADDEAIISAVRAETDKPVRVDANEGWKDRDEALKKIRWLESQNVEFVEQPMPAGMLSDVRWLRERVSLPLVADEDVKSAQDIPALAGVYDGINIKLMKSGGLQEGLRMISLARALDMKIMIGCMIESSLGISAAAQLAPMVDWADLDSHLLISNDPFTGVKMENGRLIFNDAPGVGLGST